MRSKISFLITLIFIISISSMASAREIIVDDNPGADFISIQEAVNNSVLGDTITVRSGTYIENIRVNVTGLTIRSESNNGDAQVKPLDESVSTFMIIADTVTISGLNITGADKDYDKGAIILGSDMNNLTGNTIENGCILLASETSGNLIAENKISNSKTSNSEGIHISCCAADNVVSGNTILNCSIGIYEYDQGADIRNNRIINCDYGFMLDMARGGIDNNTILNCGVGIRLGEACYIDIINNTIISCEECGIFDQENNGLKRFCNNYFNNSLNVRFGAGDGGNTWNYSLTRGTNVAGGPYIGGNFWAKPDGTGFSQICVDLDGNGIGDLPYNIYEDEFDYLPLVSLSSPQNSVTPTANFTASVTNGNAPLVVKFTDLSKNAILWNWDFDNDGISESTKQNPIYVYRIPGNYTVNLTASNGLNTNSKLANITVEKRVSSTWPFVYITSGSSDTVSMIDIATGTVITKVKVGNSPSGVAVTPNGKTAYVTNSWDDNVSVIDTTTNTVTAVVKVGSQPEGVAVSPDGKKVYVTNNGRNSVSVIDTNANDVTATVTVGKRPYGIAVTPDGKKVYVTNHYSHNVSVIDIATNMVTAMIPVGGYPSGVAVTPDGKKVYVANMNSKTVSVVDTVTNTVTATVNIYYSPHEIVVNPTGTKVYVADEYDGVISVIDTSNNTVTATVNVVGGSPEGLAATPDGKKVYVASSNTSGNNTFSVIDTSNNTVTSTANIEVYPTGIAIIPEPVYPIANFSTNVTAGYAPLSVQFTDLSENATERDWEFGDRATSNEENPIYTYSSEGNYAVKLTASNENGTDSKTTEINVKEVPRRPTAEFSAFPISGNVPLNVQFTDRSKGVPTSWRWSFGDGKTSTHQNAEHTYNKPGKYTVRLTVRNEFGTSTKTKTNLIGVVSQQLDADFSATPTAGTAPLKVQFTDKSVGSPKLFVWNFGDGIYSTQQNPAHIYSKAGNYTVSLKAVNNGGKDTETKSKYIVVSRK